VKHFPGDNKIVTHFSGTLWLQTQFVSAMPHEGLSKVCVTQSSYTARIVRDLSFFSTELQLHIDHEVMEKKESM
jgi:hypothetical protein